MIPIWKDTIYSTAIDTEFVEYHIDDMVDHTVLYAGKAYRNPETGLAEIYVNKIVENYLGNSMFPDGHRDELDYMSGYYIEVELVLSTGQDRIYEFINDWSYDPEEKLLLNVPLSKTVNAGQLIPVTIIRPYSVPNLSFRYRDKDGKSIKTINVPTKDKPEIFTYWYEVQNIAAAATLEVTFMGQTTVYQIACKPYTLYYTNAYGGYDFLCLDGNVKQTDNVTPYYYTTKATPLTPKFEKVKYLNLINPTYELHTGYVDGTKMHHLLESTQVYLFDGENGFVPVNITNTQCEHKTYQNAGNHRFTYQIDVEESQTKYRK